MRYERHVIARSPDWDICRRAGRYTVEWRHSNTRKPQQFIAVEAGYPYPLSGHKTKVPVAVAAMLAAWAGASVVDPLDHTPRTRVPSPQSSPRNATAAGIEIG